MLSKIYTITLPNTLQYFQWYLATIRVQTQWHNKNRCNIFFFVCCVQVKPGICFSAQSSSADKGCLGLNSFLAALNHHPCPCLHPRRQPPSYWNLSCSVPPQQTPQQLQMTNIFRKELGSGLNFFLFTFVVQTLIKHYIFNKKNYSK